MSDPGTREVEHQIEVGAPAAEVYRMIAQVQSWPRLFPPTVYVDKVEQSGQTERIRIWATANGEVKTWMSRRVLDPDRLRIEFRQEVPAPPVAAMGGIWQVEPLSGRKSRVRLFHDYRAVGDDPDRLAWIDQAVDRNSRAELAALQTNVELASAPGDELTFWFEDEIMVDGAAKDVYDFLNQAQLWQERLPHVDRVVLTEPSPGLQTLEMDTRARDGSVHTTKSVRVCFPYHKIVYKQVTLPALMALHTGTWLVTESAAGEGAELVVSSEHTVTINPENIGLILGEPAGVAEAREFVQAALSANSRATLGLAKEYAEHRA